MNSQRGIALAMLLWFLAAMTLLVGSIVYLGRVDMSLTRLQVAEARARAVADGAMLLLLADVFTQRRDDDRYDRRSELRKRYTYPGIGVEVVLVPVILLVDLNSASEDELEAIMKRAKGLRIADAGQLVSEIISRRSAADSFRTIEDLMLLDGMSRSILDALADSVHVSPQGASSSSLFRLDAYVAVDGRRFLRRRWVDIGKPGAGKLPWKFYRTEAVRGLGGSASNR